MMTITKSTATDPLMLEMLRDALSKYHRDLNDKRRHFADALEFLAQNDPSHRDIPMLAASADEYARKYEAMYDLLIAVDHGTVTITYDDDSLF